MATVPNPNLMTDPAKGNGLLAPGQAKPSSTAMAIAAVEMHRNKPTQAKPLGKNSGKA